MRVGEKIRRIFNPKRFNKPIKLPNKEPSKPEREKVPVRREREEEQEQSNGS